METEVIGRRVRAFQHITRLNLGGGIDHDDFYALDPRQVADDLVTVVEDLAAHVLISVSQSVPAISGSPWLR